MPGNDESFRLTLDTTGVVKPAHDAADAVQTITPKAEAAAAATEKLGQKSVNTGQAMLQTGRIIQDFAQGGIGGILNNVEGFTAALGLGSGLAGAATAVGVAFFLAYPHVKNFFQGMIDGANKIPESTDKVEKFTDALARNKKELDELKQKQTLTNTELAKFNTLTQDSIDLEKKVTAAKKEREAQEKLAGLRPEDEVEAEKARAAELQAQFGGSQDEIVAAVNAGIEKAYKDNQDVFNALPEGDPRRVGLMKKFDRLHKLRFGQDAAKNLVAGAMIGGKEGDVRAVAEFLPSLEGLPGAKFQRGFAGVLPEAEAKAEAEDTAWDEEQDAWRAVKKRRNARRAEIAKNKKEAEQDAAHWQQKLDTGDADQSQEARMRRNTLELMQRMKREKSDSADAAGIRQIQREGAAIGIHINANDALREFRRRVAEQGATQGKMVQTMLEVAREMRRQAGITDMGLDAVKAALPTNRTAQSHGTF